MKKYLAYTMGNKKSYEEAFREVDNGKQDKVEKIGRRENLDGNFYPGGCCWPTFKDAQKYIRRNKKNIPYTPRIYGVLLPNGWEEDTSDEFFDKDGHNSLLVDATIVRVNKHGEMDE